MNETWNITPKGWQVAKDIYIRYAEQGEDLDSIAASYGLTPESVGAFMAMAFAGGQVTVEEERGEGVE